MLADVRPLTVVLVVSLCLLFSYLLHLHGNLTGRKICFRIRGTNLLCLRRGWWHLPNASHLSRVPVLGIYLLIVYIL